MIKKWRSWWRRTVVLIRQSLGRCRVGCEDVFLCQQPVDGSLAETCAEQAGGRPHEVAQHESARVPDEAGQYAALAALLRQDSGDASSSPYALLACQYWLCWVHSAANSTRCCIEYICNASSLVEDRFTGFAVPRSRSSRPDLFLLCNWFSCCSADMISAGGRHLGQMIIYSEFWQAHVVRDCSLTFMCFFAVLGRAYAS